MQLLTHALNSVWGPAHDSLDRYPKIALAGVL